MHYKLRVIFCRRATNYRALLRIMTYEDKASYDSTPPCITLHIHTYTRTHAHTHTRKEEKSARAWLIILLFQTLYYHIGVTPHRVCRLNVYSCTYTHTRTHVRTHRRGENKSARAWLLIFIFIFNAAQNADWMYIHVRTNTYIYILFDKYTDTYATTCGFYLVSSGRSQRSCQKQNIHYWYIRDRCAPFHTLSSRSAIFTFSGKI